MKRLLGIAALAALSGCMFVVDANKGCDRNEDCAPGQTCDTVDRVCLPPGAPSGSGSGASSTGPSSSASSSSSTAASASSASSASASGSSASSSSSSGTSSSSTGGTSASSSGASASSSTATSTSGSGTSASSTTTTTTATMTSTTTATSSASSTGSSGSNGAPVLQFVGVSPNAPDSRYGAGLADMGDGTLLIVGGETLSTTSSTYPHQTLRVDTASGLAITGPGNPALFNGERNAAVVAIGSPVAAIYVFGGEPEPGSPPGPPAVEISLVSAGIPGAFQDAGVPNGPDSGVALPPLVGATATELGNVVVVAGGALPPPGGSGSDVYPGQALVFQEQGTNLVPAGAPTVLHDAVAFHAAAQIAPGVLCLFGGVNTSNAPSTVVQCATVSGTSVGSFASMPTLTHGRVQPSVFVDPGNHEVYVVGGLNGALERNVTNVSAVVDVDMAPILVDGGIGTFTYAAGLPSARGGAIALQAGGEDYLIGGLDNTTAPSLSTNTIVRAP